MSIERRKIGHYTLEMVSEEEHCFKPTLFKEFLYDLLNIPKDERLENIRQQNKALLLQDVSETTTSAGMNIVNIVFGSCKYNHAPDYMSSENGNIRATTKQKEEGEQELTHLSIWITEQEGYVVIEERKSGVTIGTIEKYLSTWFLCYQKKKEMDSKYKLEIMIVPQDDFLTMLNKCERVCSAELYVDKELLGSDYLNFAGIPSSVRNELTLNVMPIRGKSIDRSMISQAFNMIFSGSSKIKRIRIRIKDDEGVLTIVDSLHGKRKNEVKVELNDNGTVNSTSMFQALKGVLTGDVYE